MELVIGGSEPVQTYARNVLLSNKLISYQEPVDLPDETKSSMAGNDPKRIKLSCDGLLNLFPNPAQQYVIVEYNFTGKVSGSESMVLTIYSGGGKKIEQRNMTSLHDQILIDCRNIKSGIYLCKMTHGRQTLGSGKFVISK